MNRIEFLHNLDKYKGEDHSTFLQHYGILGQKWGQRRWQNPDGTFNAEGKERYFGSKKAETEIKSNNKNKRYNEKGEELAHPDDPYDELTVNRLNEIRKLYPNINTQDQKLGSWKSEKAISKAVKNRDLIIEAMEEDPNTNLENIKIGNQSGKRYNAKGEELAHPDDPYDELTVDRLNEIKKMYLSENNKEQGKSFKDVSNDLNKASEELSKAGNTEEAKKCKDTANEINEVRQNDRKLYKEMTKEEKKEYKKAERECVKTANKGNWINVFLWGPLIGGIINGVDSWATIKVGMEKCGITKEDRKYLTADDWRDINLAIMQTYPKKYKKELAMLEEQGVI